MITEAGRARIRQLAGRYPDGRSALLPALELVQHGSGGFLSHEDVRQVARLLRIPVSTAWGAATFYSLLRIRPVGRSHLQVDTGVPALLAGADGILRTLLEKLDIAAGETTPDGLFTVSAVEDLGCADICPVVRVNDTVHGNLTPAGAAALVEALKRGKEPKPDLATRHDSACGVLLRNFDSPDVREIDAARAGGGYRALEKARGMTPGQVTAAVEESGLRGRGGAAFPTARKWRSLPGDERPVFLICNADEGEPGTFKDRQIMERDPHLLIEGIAIAARAVGAARAFVYVRGEYSHAAAVLERAVAQAEESGLLEDLVIIVHRGAGSYVCGEETALIASLEGGRGEPRPRPPYPASSGLYGHPTVVNNVETLASLPFIVGEGAAAFRAASPVLFCLSGRVERPGLYERPLGTALGRLIEEAGGLRRGPGGSRGRLKGVIVGGLSSPILRAGEAVGLSLDYESCSAAGTSLGSGAVIVLDDTVSIPRIALRASEFFAGESCGQCAPCREGSFAVRSLLEGIVAGGAGRGDSDRILEICRGVIGAALCPGGNSFASSIASMVSKFREEFTES